MSQPTGDDAYIPLERLTRRQPPWVLLWPGSRRSTWAVVEFGRSTDLAVVHLDGAHCRTWPAFHSHVAAALQFNEYYGKNMNAFDDCMFDMPSPAHDRGDGITLVIWSADALLSGEPAEALQVLLQHFVWAGESLANVSPGQWNGPRAFHAVLQVRDIDVRHFTARLAFEGKASRRSSEAAPRGRESAADHPRDEDSPATGSQTGE